MGGAGCCVGGQEKSGCGLVLIRSPLLTSLKWSELLSSGCLVCRCHDAFLWCYVCFVLLRFRIYAFVEAATLRSIVLRYAGASIAARVFIFWRCRFSEYFLYHFRFLFVSFVWRVRRTFFPSGWCFLFFIFSTLLLLLFKEKSDHT